VPGASGVIASVTAAVDGAHRPLQREGQLVPGEGGTEGGQQPRQDMVGGVLGGADGEPSAPRQRAGFPAVRVGEVTDQLIVPGEKRAGPVDELAADGRETDAALLADQQAGTDPPLEQPDVLAHRGLAQVEHARGPGEALPVHHSDQGPQMGQVQWLRHGALTGRSSRAW
jgi:hypothetical protein